VPRRQSRERFEGGVAQSLEWAVNGTPERVAISMRLTVTSEENVEIGTVV
jgi:hypothetical protein